MLSGSEIIKCVKEGSIEIDPFNVDQVNPNSYNLRIGNKLRVYKNFFEKDEITGGLRFTPIQIAGTKNLKALDPKKENETYEIDIPEVGLILLPGILYLGSTVERTFTKDYVPCISGRSSYARLGLEVHQTAGFGDVGVNLNWTLELSVIHPLVIYSNTEICQVYFEEITGGLDMQYHGKYQNQRDIIPSRSFKDFE